MTPMGVKAIELPKGVAWTGERQTCITYSSSGSDNRPAIRPLRVDNGLSHPGEPEGGVIVLEEPRDVESGPRVVKVLRAPTRKDIEAHEATHVPHDKGWCEFSCRGQPATS